MRGLFVIVFCLLFTKCFGEGINNIPNPVRFPYGGPFMGIFVAIAVPLELDNYNVYVSYNFEGNYVLPSNETEWDYPTIVSRSFGFDRKYFYDAFEYKFKSHGYPGKPCVLRAVCEAAQHSLRNNGVLADILHIILSPSTSRSEGLQDYDGAENYGKLHKHCKRYKKTCSLSILNLITWLGNIV